MTLIYYKKINYNSSCFVLRLGRFFFVIFFTINLPTFSNCNFSFAEEKIIFVDIDYIYANTIAGKKINNQLEFDKQLIDLDGSVD